MDDHSIDTHPDLIDPDWRRKAERAARRGLKKPGRARKPRRRLGAGSGAILALAVLVATSVLVNQLRSESPKTNASTPSPAAPTTAPSTLPPVAQVDLTRPFANTPAAAWPEGTAGFTVPTAAKVGSASADDVAAAFGKVEKLIDAAHLDRKLVEGHDPEGLLSQLAPNEAKRVRAILDKPDKSDAAGYVTLVADGFHLLASNPRLEGRLTARPGAESGELTIHAEYVIAYAFDTANPGQLTSPGDIVAFDRGDDDFTIVTGSRFYQADQGLQYDGGKGSEYFSMACGPFKTGYLAPRYSERDYTGKGVDAQQEAAIYDLDKPIDLTDSCGS